MSRVQKLFQRILPPKWAISMEASSRAWIVRCSCGFGRSVWEMGGIRWNAGTGRPRWFAECPQCGRRSWHIVVRDGLSANSR